MTVFRHSVYRIDDISNSRPTVTFRTAGCWPAQPDQYVVATAHSIFSPFLIALTLSALRHMHFPLIRGWRCHRGTRTYREYVQHKTSFANSAVASVFTARRICNVHIAQCMLWPEGRSVRLSHAGVPSKGRNGPSWFAAQRLHSPHPTLRYNVIFKKKSTSLWNFVSNPELSGFFIFFTAARRPSHALSASFDRRKNGGKSQRVYGNESPRI